VEAELGADAKEHEPEERMPGDDTVMSISVSDVMYHYSLGVCH
jgi:hypothetical protein